MVAYLTKLRTSTEAYVDRLKRRFHFPSCLSITNQDKPGTTVRRVYTRSHSDLDIYVESSCAICTEIVRETWSKLGRKVLNAQVKIERAIEKALLSDGYSRDELSQRSKRDERRTLLFYRTGKLLSMKTYDSYVKEVELGTHRSQPYKVLINAISSSNLFLKKVKKIKRWERG